MKKYRVWYSNLNDKHKLLVQFVFQWIYWSFAWMVFEKIFPGDKPLTLARLLFMSTWMAIIMTIPFNWKKVKAIFKKKQTSE